MSQKEMWFYDPTSQEFGKALQSLICSTNERHIVETFLSGFIGKRFSGPVPRWFDVGNGKGTMNNLFLTLSRALLTLEPNDFLFNQAHEAWKEDDRVTSLQGSAENFVLDASTPKVQVATCVFVDHHFPNPLRTMAQHIMPAVEPGGYIIVVNNGKKSPASELHRRLGYFGGGPAKFLDLYDDPRVDRVEMKSLTGSCWLMTDPDKVFEVARFIAGDHAKEYAYPIESEFQRAVRELFLDEAVTRPNGLAYNLDVVTIKLR